MMKKVLTLAAVGLLITALVHADGLETILIGPQAVLTAGQSTDLTVLWTNPTDQPQQLQIPASLACLLDTAEETHSLDAAAVTSATDPTTEIPPRGFIKQKYTLRIPASISGRVNLECTVTEVHRVSFQVDAADANSAAQAQQPVQAGDAAERQALETLQSRFQMFADKLSFYDPMYFLVGIDPEESKFQLSFKYRFFNREAPLVQHYPWIEGFHLAYTQTSFWDLRSESAPFQDTSYKPELFFLSPNLGFEIPRLYLFKIQTGFQHESNGRGGEDSRSTNYLYLKPILIFGKGTPYAMEVALKSWLYVANDEETNPDLSDYRGYFDLELKFGRARSFALSTHYTYARAGSSFQVDVTYPLSRFLFGNLDLYLQAQYFNGYAESLLNYTEKTEALRLGLSIVR